MENTAASNSSAESSSVSAQGIDGVIARLNIDMKMRSDPALLSDILKTDMYLADMASFITLLGEKLTTPQDLGPLMEQMRTGIITKHPAINELASVAIRDNLVPPAEPGNPHITRSIHHTFLLEHLLQGMMNDWKFMVEVHDHLMKKREEFGVRSGFYESVIDIFKISGFGGLFELAKAKTKDADFQVYTSVRSKGAADKKDSDGRKKALSLNISEAVTADYVKGFKDNALSGAVLAVIRIKNVSVSAGTRLLKLDLSQDWVSLYETWNMCFITSKLDYLPILYPKLLAPAVMNAEPDDYIFVRGMGLWLSVNFFLFKKITKTPSATLAGKDALAMKWGEINLKYAKALFKKEKNKELLGFSTIFGLMF